MNTVTYLEPAGWPVVIGAALSEVAFAKEMIRLDVDNPTEFVPAGAAAATLRIESENENDTILVCMDLKTAQRKHTLNDLRSLLVHEAVHVWQFIKIASGEDKPGMETEAYFIQYIVQWLFKLLDQGRGK